MPRAKKRKVPTFEPGPDGLVEVEVIDPRLDRKEGDRYKVDPARAAVLLRLGLASLPAQEESDG